MLLPQSIKKEEGFTMRLSLVYTGHERNFMEELIEELEGKPPQVVFENPPVL